MESGNNERENAEVTPEALHTFFREDGQVLGHLVVDSNINGLCGGGIRMVPEMPVADLCHLARAMTLKYGFLKWPFGGAKAAILTHRDDLPATERERCLELFAERLTLFRGRYLPGEDAGTNAEDLHRIRRIARLEQAGHHTPDSGFYTGLTVRICLEHLLRQQHLAPADCTVALEGLGKVGGAAARLLSELGCRIVAVSTRRGAIHDPDGLDIEQLLQARATFGDDCVLHYDRARRIEPAQLLSLPAEFLVPCALSWSVRGTNAGEVQARAIVCGANNAVTDKAKEILAARGITYFPDFVSNSGGVLGSIIEILCRDRTRSVALLRELFEPKVENLLARAASTGSMLDAAARAIAQANHREMKQREAAPRGRGSALMTEAFRRGLLPRRLVRFFAPAYLRRTMV
jgi:glutamate dehydrogenase (NAD(P)+)